jgi:energy-coupling factor transporter ATP-binding protein EcfA2
VPSQGIPEFSATFERVNVILGANGVGKTKLLQHLVNNSEGLFGSTYTPVSIEGGRAITIPVGVAMDNQNIAMFSNPLVARDQYKLTRRQTLASRIIRTFVMMRVLENQEKTRHSDAVHAWSQGGREGDLPERSLPPFNKLTNLFSEVFPDMRLEITPSEQIYVRKGEAYYPVSSMSEGEKQVFTLLADIAVLTNERSIFFVDEPELNLHPTLAEKLWTSIEEAYPDDVFVYTTHSLSFALRLGVDYIYAIGHGKISLDFPAHSSVDLRPFLGSIPGIVRSRRNLFVEGEQASFDKPFYSWLLDGQEFEVLPVGASTDVVAACKRDGVWQQMSALIQIAGVIDRDFKGDNLELGNKVLMLPVHEAESFLCHPDVILAIHNALGNQTSKLNREQIVDELIKDATERLPFVVAQRLFSRTYINLGMSMSRSYIQAESTVDGIRPLLIEAARLEAAKAISTFDEGAIQRAISEHELACRKAISDRNVEELLVIFEGKRLLSRLCKIAGCPSPLGLLNAAKKHLAVDDVPGLARFRDRLKATLGD